MPDFSGRYQVTAEVGPRPEPPASLRRINWDDTRDDAFDLSGSATGWGMNLSSALKATKSDVVRLAFVVRRRHPERDERLAGRHRHREQPRRSGDAGRRQADPDRRRSACSSITTWNKKFSSAVGYSWQDNDNTDAQAPDAFRRGHYALGNLLYYPVPNVMVGGELQWGRRENFSDGFTSDGFKVQFSFKYNFSYKLGG